MAAAFTAFATGIVAGVFSAMFGIGGGIIITPATRLLLGVPALTAVGTTLPVIIPGTIVGAWSFLRRDAADLRVGVIAGLGGTLSAVAGAAATNLVGGPVVLIGVACLIGVAALDVVAYALKDRPEAERAGVAEHSGEPTTLRAAAAGAATGLFSGFFGLGGGLVLVPLLTRWLHLPLKRGIGTSLIAISILAIPGAVTHAALGHVDWAVAAGLVAGVIPGAFMGARLNEVTREGVVRIGFAVLLVATAVRLAASEIARLS